jgi:hypothetical protein
VFAQGYCFEADKVSVVIYPTITVLHHISGNFLTAPRSLHNPTKGIIIAVLTPCVFVHGLTVIKTIMSKVKAIKKLRFQF